MIFASKVDVDTNFRIKNDDFQGFRSVRTTNRYEQIRTNTNRGVFWKMYVSTNRYEPIRTAVRTFLLGTNRYEPKKFWKVRTGTNRAGKMLEKGLRKKFLGEKIFFTKKFFSCQIQKKVILLTD